MFTPTCAPGKCGRVRAPSLETPSTLALPQNVRQQAAAAGRQPATYWTRERFGHWLIQSIRSVVLIGAMEWVEWLIQWFDWEWSDWGRLNYSTDPITLRSYRSEADQTSNRMVWSDWSVRSDSNRSRSNLQSDSLIQPVWPASFRITIGQIRWDSGETPIGVSWKKPHIKSCIYLFIMWGYDVSYFSLSDLYVHTTKLYCVVHTEGTSPIGTRRCLPQNVKLYTCKVKKNKINHDNPGFYIGLCFETFGKESRASTQPNPP